MTMMFDEEENYYFEKFNDWYEWFIDDSYRNVKKDGWVKRFRYFVCLKNETVDDLVNRYNVLLSHLKDHEIFLTDAEKVSKFADVLPIEWSEFVKNLRKDSNFSKLHLKGFISKLKTHEYENGKKRKELIKVLETHLVDISLDVIDEMNKRVVECIRAKYVMKYNNKRGYYLDENANPLDFIKIFCAGTFRTKEEEASKVEEYVKFGSSSSNSVCSKCHSFKTKMTNL
ncbi:hypothetical protein Hanom_Chr07g00617681 [Helianthus anomalus]